LESRASGSISSARSIKRDRTLEVEAKELNQSVFFHLQVDAEEQPDVTAQFVLVHNGLELETRWRLTAAPQPTLEQLEHTLDFHRFCVLLERLATEAWPHLPPADAINHLLFEHVYPLCCGGDNGDRPMRGATVRSEPQQRIAVSESQQLTERRARSHRGRRTGSLLFKHSSWGAAPSTLEVPAPSGGSLRRSPSRPQV